MPSADTLAVLTRALSQRMADAVTPYYDAVDRYGADSIQATVALSLVRKDLERAVRENHIEAALIGGGGQLSDEARVQLREIITTDTNYVNGFADALPTLSRDQALIRANMYVSTQKDTATQITLLELPTLPIEPKSDDLQCQWHCRCGLDIRFLFGPGNFDVYWLIDPLGREHCPDCIRLAATWRPLAIRNGVIVGQKMVKQRDLDMLFMAFDHIKSSRGIDTKINKNAIMLYTHD